MALKTCNKCNAENADGSLYCNRCGNKIEISQSTIVTNEISEKYDVSSREKMKVKKSDKGFFRNYIRVLVVGIIASMISVLIYLYYPIYNYNNGVSTMKDGDYESAITIFLELGDYKDSVQKVNECKYEIANKYVDNKNYDTAIAKYKEIERYIDVGDKITSTYYLLGKQSIIEKNYKNAIYALEKCLEYKDTNDILKKAKYDMAIDYYKKGTLGEAFKLFKDLKSYKKAKSYSEKIHYYQLMQGTWECSNEKDIYEVVIMDKRYQRAKNNEADVEPYILKMDTKGKAMSNEFYYIIKDDKLFEYRNNDNEVMRVYKKISNSMAFRSTVKIEDTYMYKSEPTIGMTKDEVKNSTWGKPNDINITETVYGVSEQWVYSRDRYIYLDDGIVTAIQK